MRLFYAALVLVFLLSMSAEAAIVLVEEDVSLSEADINDNLYILTSDLYLDTQVRGDILSLSRNANFMGPVYGDLSFAAGEGTINADVRGNVRALVGDIIISSDISGDVALVGGNIRIDNNVDVGGDILALGNRIELVNSHPGDIKLRGERIILHSAISGDAELHSSNIEMWNGAEIFGDLRYTAKERNEELERRVHGEVTFTQDRKGAIMGLFGAFGVGVGSVFLNLSWILLLLAVGLLIIHLCPNFASLVAGNMRRRRLASLIYGIAFIFVIPMVSFLFLITVIGIPISALLMISLGLGFMFGKIYTIFVVGGWMRENIFPEKKTKASKKTKKTPAERRDIRFSADYAIGLLAYALLSFIPVISFLVSVAAALFGIGALALAKLELFYFLKESKKL